MIHTPAQTNLIKHTLTVKGATAVAYESGHGAPALLLHGSPDTHAMWLPVMNRLNDHMRCFALDLLGFGESTLPNDFALTLDNMADFIRDVLRALTITEPITLLMTDFGGHYGLAFAVKYPDLVKGLVISNTNFFHDYDWHSFAKLYRAPLIGEFLMATSFKPVLDRTLKSVAPALPNDYINASYPMGFGSTVTRKTILRMYRERNPQDFNGWEDRLLALLAHKPSLVLWGDQDPFITPAYAERFGTAHVQHFPQFSHWLPLETPDGYADAVLAWFATL